MGSVAHPQVSPGVRGQAELAGTGLVVCVFLWTRALV